MAEAELNPYKSADGTPQMLPSVVAYLDILGYKALMNAAFEKGIGQQELIRLRNALDVALRFVNMQHQWPPPNGKARFIVRTFTDNLVIGYPVPKHSGTVSVLLNMINYVGYLQMALVEEGYFLRGALSVGDLYADTEIVFGPALMEAFEGERTLAIYPRVILCDSARESYSKHWQRAPEVLIDSDERMFVDYLDGTVLIAQPDGPVFSEFVDAHKTSIIAKLKEYATKPRIWAKYDWAAKYHNAFCDMHPELFVEYDRVPSALFSIPPRPCRAAPSKDEAGNPAPPPE